MQYREWQVLRLGQGHCGARGEAQVGDRLGVAGEEAEMRIRGREGEGPGDPAFCHFAKSNPAHLDTSAKNRIHCLGVDFICPSHWSVYRNQRADRGPAREYSATESSG